MSRKITVAAVALVLLVAAGAAAALAFVVPLPAPKVDLSTPHEFVFDSSRAPAIPLPATGSFALATSLDGEIASADADTPHPIASITKTMSALAVLQAHPLPPGGDGPRITVTQTDVALIAQVIAEGGSYSPVVAGEVLTERDLLLGMMLPSANNFAIMAANWVDGGVAPFVTRLNRMATAMGMTETYFDDPDGLTDKTVSSANDLLKLGRAAVANPVLRSLTQQSQATLPAGTGVIHNIDAPLLAHPGWLGIKTGHTFAAGYCLLFAAQNVSQHGLAPVTVVGVVMGQATREATFTASSTAVDAALGGYVNVDLNALKPAATGTVTTTWRASSGLREIALQTWVTVRRGSAGPISVTRTSPAAWDRAGALVAHISAPTSGRMVTWNVVTASPLGPPSPWERFWAHL